MVRRPGAAERAATAYHEAGHAVVAWLVDHVIGVVTIVPATGAAGCVRHHEQGAYDIFDLEELEPYADAPGGFVVRVGGAGGRHLTDDEQTWLEIQERLEPSPAEAHVMIAAAGQEAERVFDAGSVEAFHSAGDWESAEEHLQQISAATGIVIATRPSTKVASTRAGGGQLGTRG